MANSFKPVLNKEAERVKKENETQERLHDKYKEVPKDTKIVENSAVKTTAQVLATILRIVIEIIIVLFATVGILAIIFPASRNAMLDTFNQFVTEFKALLPF